MNASPLAALVESLPIPEGARWHHRHSLHGVKTRDEAQRIADVVGAATGTTPVSREGDDARWFEVGQVAVFYREA